MLTIYPTSQWCLSVQELKNTVFVRALALHVLLTLRNKSRSERCTLYVANENKKTKQNKKTLIFA